ncbi:hypothetical protein [Nesterenkonia muleiensis]|uniref:hypothetical protein n=1 Tax=Nesterenkonia muleiensis TaxID=2282648 RepID=UPI00192E6D66|nr:hypothetical protein [Nesterenkonia muleiensis]
MELQQLLSWDNLIVGDVLGEYHPIFDVDHVREFQSIVDPAGQVYDETVFATLAYDTLHAVKAYVRMPQGTVHAKEAVEFHGLSNPELPVRVLIVVGDRSVRRGKRNFTLEYRVFTGDDHVLTAYKSFVIPGKVDERDSTAPKTFEFGLFDGGKNSDETIPELHMVPVEFTVEQQLLDDFGRVTATDGPIHTDPVVAEKFFGGTILQGMYLFELASQVMTRLSSPLEWMSSGRLVAKITGSSITGESVTLVPTFQRVIPGESPRVLCAIEAHTESGRTVFVAQADGPLSADNLVKE